MDDLRVCINSIEPPCTYTLQVRQGGEGENPQTHQTEGNDSRGFLRVGEESRMREKINFKMFSVGGTH